MSSRFFSQRGFSMVEVLVTIILISIGILGMVAKQSKTIVYTQDSVQRNTAAMLADDLMEIMRTNASAPSGYYKAMGTAFPTAASSCEPLPNSPQQRLGCWAARTAAALPGAADLGTAEYEVKAEGRAISIRLAWRTQDGQCLDPTRTAADQQTICVYTLVSEL